MVVMQARLRRHLSEIGHRRSWRTVLWLGVGNIAVGAWLLFILRWTAFDGLSDALRIALLALVKGVLPVTAFAVGVYTCFAAGTLYWRQQHGAPADDPFDAARRVLPEADDVPPPQPPP